MAAVCACIVTCASACPCTAMIPLLELESTSLLTKFASVMLSFFSSGSSNVLPSVLYGHGSENDGWSSSPVQNSPHIRHAGVRRSGF